MPSEQEDRAKRLQKMATKAFVLNSLSRVDCPESDNNHPTESYDPATQLPRAQLEEELLAERQSIGNLQSEIASLKEQLAQHKEEKQTLEDSVKNTQTSLKDAETSLAAEKKQREEDRIALENDKKKSLEDKDKQFKQQKEDDLEQLKNKIRNSDLIPVLCGGKQFLTSKEKLIDENCPFNVLSKMIDGSKDFEIENGFLKLDLEPDVFETLIDFLINRDSFEMPETSEELKKLANAARKLGVNDLLEDCKKQQILSSVPTPEVFSFSSLGDAEQLLNKSSKTVVNLSVNLSGYDSSLTTVSITEHYNVFFTLGRLLRNKFTFIFAPDYNNGVFWNFYRKGEKIFCLPFHDMDHKNQDSGKVNVFSPSQGSRQGNSTKTITEVFLSIFSDMKLKEPEKKKFYDLTWWQKVLNNETPISRRNSLNDSE